jgi:hypothetical protein
MEHCCTNFDTRLSVSPLRPCGRSPLICDRARCRSVSRTPSSTHLFLPDYGVPSRSPHAPAEPEEAEFGTCFDKRGCIPPRRRTLGVPTHPCSLRRQPRWLCRTFSFAFEYEAASKGPHHPHLRIPFSVVQPRTFAKQSAAPTSPRPCAPVCTL